MIKSLPRRVKTLEDILKKAYIYSSNLGYKNVKEAVFTILELISESLKRFKKFHTPNEKLLEQIRNYRARIVSIKTYLLVYKRFRKELESLKTQQDGLVSKIVIDRIIKNIDKVYEILDIPDEEKKEMNRKINSGWVYMVAKYYSYILNKFENPYNIYTIQYLQTLNTREDISKIIKILKRAKIKYKEFVDFTKENPSSYTTRDKDEISFAYQQYTDGVKNVLHNLRRRFSPFLQTGVKK